jgi:hypothetical protein
MGYGIGNSKGQRESISLNDCEMTIDNQNRSRYYLNIKYHRGVW